MRSKTATPSSEFAPPPESLEEIIKRISFEYEFGPEECVFEFWTGGGAYYYYKLGKLFAPEEGRWMSPQEGLEQGVIQCVECVLFFVERVSLDAECKGPLSEDAFKHLEKLSWGEFFEERELDFDFPVEEYFGLGYLSPVVRIVVELSKGAGAGYHLYG